MTAAEVEACYLKLERSRDELTYVRDSLPAGELKLRDNCLVLFYSIEALEAEIRRSRHRLMRPAP